jgi:serine/threonine-protein kinase RsbT
MTMFKDICGVLGRHYSGISSRAIVRMALKRARVKESELESLVDYDRLLKELKRGMQLFASSPAARQECLSRLELMLRVRRNAREQEILRGEESVRITAEQHIVEARTTARGMAATIGFGRTDQVKVSTAVSELARNIYRYVGAGVVSIRYLREPRAGIEIEARDTGPGISNIDEILSGSFKSKTGMGLGIIGCKNLMDEFRIDTAPGKGTLIVVRKYR